MLMKHSNPVRTMNMVRAIFILITSIIFAPSNSAADTGYLRFLSVSPQQEAAAERCYIGISPNEVSLMPDGVSVFRVNKNNSCSKKNGCIYFITSISNICSPIFVAGSKIYSDGSIARMVNPVLFDPDKSEGYIAFQSWLSERSLILIYAEDRFLVY